MSKTLLLISKIPQDQEFAAEVAIAAGLSLRTEANPVEAAQIILDEAPAVIFVDASDKATYESFEVAIQEKVGLFSTRVNSNNIHFITAEDITKIQYLIQSPIFGHYILRNFTNIKEAGEYYGRVTLATLSDRAFGIERLLKPGTKVQVIQLKRSTQKQNAVEAVKTFLIGAKFQSRMATVIANAVDELLMNAIFDAPVDNLGKPIYGITARTTQINLENKAAVEMHVGYDKNYVVVSAVDYFGSLDKNKLFSHISKLYTEEEYKIRHSMEGAGIGLATVFHTGGSFFFISERGVKTEVCVFFKRTNNFREFKNQFRFISTQFYFE